MHHAKHVRHNVLSLWSDLSVPHTTEVAQMGRISLGLSHTVGWGLEVGGLLARWGCEAPVGPLEAGWLMGRGGGHSQSGLGKEERLVGMAEGCWTLAQSGDCLSVQALGHSSLLPQAPTPEWAFQRDMPALSLSITLLPLLSLPPFPCSFSVFICDLFALPTTQVSGLSISHLKWH